MITSVAGKFDVAVDSNILGDVELSFSRLKLRIGTRGTFMTSVKYQAIYARTDYDAARRYRIDLRRWVRNQRDAQRSKYHGEISETEREEFLSHKVVNEARELLSS